jgi:hypothetical protein
MLLLMSMWFLPLIHAWVLPISNRWTMRGVRDPVTGAPFNAEYLTTRLQASSFQFSAMMLSRAAGFSLLKYLPSIQTLVVLANNRRRFVLTLLDFVNSYRSALDKFPLWVVVIGGFVGTPVAVLALAVYLGLLVGPYILAPIAFVIKLRYQVCVRPRRESALCASVLTRAVVFRWRSRCWRRQETGPYQTGSSSRR